MYTMHFDVYTKGSSTTLRYVMHLMHLTKPLGHVVTEWQDHYKDKPQILHWIM